MLVDSFQFFEGTVPRDDHKTGGREPSRDELGPLPRLQNVDSPREQRARVTRVRAVRFGVCRPATMRWRAIQSIVCGLVRVPRATRNRHSVRASVPDARRQHRPAATPRRLPRAHPQPRHQVKLTPPGPWPMGMWPRTELRSIGWNGPAGRRFTVAQAGHACTSPRPRS